MNNIMNWLTVYAWKHSDPVRPDGHICWDIASGNCPAVCPAVSALADPRVLYKHR